MDNREKDLSKEEILRLLQIIDSRIFRHQTLYQDWTQLGNRCNDYLDYLEYSDEESKRRLSPEFVEYLRDYISSEFTRLNNLG